MIDLPQPSKNAQNLAAIVMAICSDLVPWGGGTLREIFSVYQNQQVDKYRKILVEEIQNYGAGVIDKLNEGQTEFIIPAAYRFFEQVRLGEYEQNLRVLARFIGGSLADGSSVRVPGDVGRFARQLEYLDEYCLRILCAALKLKDKISVTRDPDKVPISSGGLIYHLSEFSPGEAPRIRTCLAILSSRGFLYPDGSMSTGKEEEDYYLSEDARMLSRYLQGGEAK